MKKKALLWLLAFILTLLLAVYQRLSGPTYPIRGSETITGITIHYKFSRSWTSGRELPVRVSAANPGLEMLLHYRRYPYLSDEKWNKTAMKKIEGGFEASVPGQPPAGKVAYKVEATAKGKHVWLNRGQPAVARFKGEVPTALLIFHVIFMFAAMLLAFRTGLEALRRDGCWQKLVPWTLAVTSIGGLILGPLVQKYAFGAFWTGFPLGGDLTDSKTLFAVLFWLAAFFMRKKSRWWTLAATVLMVTVYLIPHSMLGSELNYQTGKIETAKEVRGSTLKIK
ncbi:MAG: hypothetical protein E4H23_03195 [Chrysiogenales bacterium]|nr:MAG: hypothetical protein E4H23_03195 [Chrysiogenales bacterium]